MSRPSDAQGWTVAAAAERVGVSVSTLRSWEQRYGLHPRARTSGGHRRYTANDVVVLQRVQQLVAAGMPTGAAAATVRGDRAAVTGTAGRSALARLDDAAARLDAAAMRRLVARLLTEHGAVAAWTDVFVPALQELGRCWERTGTGVHREHLLVQVLRTELDRHASRQARGSLRDGRVLLAATATEGHTLPLHAVAAALAERGIGADLFGSLPGDAVQAAVAELVPPAVLIWARSRASAEVAVLRPLTDAVPVVCAAGRGWPARIRDVTVTRELRATVDLLAAVTP